MTLSPIQLDFCYVESLRWKVEPEYEPESPAQLSLDDLEWNVERNDETEDGRYTAYRLTLCLPPRGARYPYSFELVAVGTFLLDETVPADRVATVLDANAPALLYSMAREVLATSLGRGPFRSLLLPSVHFMNLKREASGIALPEPIETAAPSAAASRPKSARSAKAGAKAGAKVVAKLDV